MKKNKEGKVVASLTEVKNKTGDIFAVVDEYGEILLTSYNKPRYRITKVDLSESLELDSDKPKAAKKAKQKVNKPSEKGKTVEVTKETTNTEVEKEVQPVEKAPATQDEIEEKGTENEIKAWDADNPLEKSYIETILQPLQ